MRVWKGVHDDTDAHDMSSLQAGQNLSLYTTGEVGRRNAYSLAAGSSGINVVHAQDQFGVEYAVFFTSAGAIVSEPL